MIHKIHVYKDEAGEWRWRALTLNGRVVAESGEGYKQRRNALRPLYNLLNLPEPTRRTGFYWWSEIKVTVKLGKSGHPERVVWDEYRDGFRIRTVQMDVVG